VNRTPHPLEVRRDVDGHVVHISWNDGHESTYPFAHLRGWCPCAGCQGHSGEKRYIDGANSELQRIAPVGRYALTFVWGDGHETGIYTYPYLRQLCQCVACKSRSSNS
jgi:DUF971 family protein